MPGLAPPALSWAFAAVQILGLASAWTARLSMGSRRQTACQILFLGCLILAGTTTGLAVCLGPGCWLLCGTTFSVMVLTATCDFTRPDRVGAWRR